MITGENILKIEARLPEFISGKRLVHTFAVAKEAKALAELYGMTECDCLRLYVAGLLHDITKERTPAAQTELCREFGESYTEDELKSPKIFHSITGAHIAKELFPDIVDDGIYDAIRYHTTGRADMTLMDKLLYLADYIEPTRTFPDCVELRRMFYNSEVFDTEHLDRILLASFDMTISSLISDGQCIHPRTVAARNRLIK